MEIPDVSFLLGRERTDAWLADNYDGSASKNRRPISNQDICNPSERKGDKGRSLSAETAAGGDLLLPVGGQQGRWPSAMRRFCLRCALPDAVPFAQPSERRAPNATRRHKRRPKALVFGKNLFVVGARRVDPEPSSMPRGLDETRQEPSFALRAHGGIADINQNHYRRRRGGFKSLLDRAAFSISRSAASTRARKPVVIFCGMGGLLHIMRVTAAVIYSLEPLRARWEAFPGRYLVRMVGVAGFEPATPSSRTRCATRLRYTPTDGGGL